MSPCVPSFSRAAASSTAQLRPRRRSSRHTPPQCSYPRPSLLLPHLDCRVVTFDRRTRSKYAAWMDMNDIKSATIIINNNARMCPKDQNCKEAVAHILSVSSTLTVYYPGSKETLRGARPK
ncbi:hypothetical protein OG795_33190 (plasmid) [[Kitasatospora] papulosa]|uniref:DddA-like double-stranded DNA deaminase toxin n=1 Tax=[Kitasatospora] papulosa TaxID=1464011 RepID=UPI002F916580